MVTHWSVNDQVAAFLVARHGCADLTGRGRPARGAAQGAARSAGDRRLRDHPFFWAPLAVIGDGGGGGRTRWRSSPPRGARSITPRSAREQDGRRRRGDGAEDPREIRNPPRAGARRRRHRLRGLGPRSPAASRSRPSGCPTIQDAETAEEIARFRREAQAAARLTHPNIVAVYDYGETADLAYIVMEFVDGPSLKAPLGQARRFRRRAIQLMGDLLAGLQFSHERGVVHRDIKPANIMMTRRPGEDRRFRHRAHRKQQHDPGRHDAGHAAYMSPEQFRGEVVDAAPMSIRPAWCCTSC